MSLRLFGFIGVHGSTYNDNDDHDEDEDEDVLSPPGAAGARGFEDNVSHADARGLDAFRKQRSEVRLSISLHQLLACHTKNRYKEDLLNHEQRCKTTTPPITTSLRAAWLSLARMVLGWYVPSCLYYKTYECELCPSSSGRRSLVEEGYRATQKGCTSSLTPCTLELQAAMPLIVKLQKQANKPRSCRRSLKAPRFSGFAASPWHPVGRPSGEL